MTRLTNLLFFILFSFSFAFSQKDILESSEKYKYVNGIKLYTASGNSIFSVKKQGVKATVQKFSGEKLNEERRNTYKLLGYKLQNLITFRNGSTVLICSNYDPRKSEETLYSIQLNRETAELELDTKTQISRSEGKFHGDKSGSILAPIYINRFSTCQNPDSTKLHIAYRSKEGLISIVTINEENKVLTKKYHQLNTQKSIRELNIAADQFSNLFVSFKEKKGSRYTLKLLNFSKNKEILKLEGQYAIQSAFAKTKTGGVILGGYLSSSMMVGTNSIFLCILKPNGEIEDTHFKDVSFRYLMDLITIRQTENLEFNFVGGNHVSEIMNSVTDKVTYNDINSFFFSVTSLNSDGDITNQMRVNKPPIGTKYTPLKKQIKIYNQNNQITIFSYRHEKYMHSEDIPFYSQSNQDYASVHLVAQKINVEKSTLTESFIGRIDILKKNLLPIKNITLGNSQITNGKYSFEAAQGPTKNYMLSFNLRDM